MPLVPCKQCKKPFYAKPSAVLEGNGKYCSIACHHAVIRKGKEVSCDMCGAAVYRSKKELGRSASKKFFCGKSCQTRWRNQTYVGERHKNFKTGIHAYRATLDRAGVPKICRLCKTTDYRILAVHHIDKNRKNNKVSNLAWLCHNCHFLIHHDAKERDRFMAAIV